MAPVKKKGKAQQQVINSKARFAYEVIASYVAGLVLKGSEVKSIRSGLAQLKDAYCFFLRGELWSKGVHIAPYPHATSSEVLAPNRVRKLLLNRRELTKIKRLKEERGYTIVPLRLFIQNNGLVKLEVAIAKGKKKYDKREAIKSRDIERKLARGDNITY